LQGLTERDAAHLGRADPIDKPRRRLLEDLAAIRQRERVLEPEHAPDRRRTAIEIHLADPLQHRAVAREPADRIEARRERHDAIERDPAVGRAHAEQAAVAGGDAHRACGIAAEREIHQTARRR